MDETVLGIAHGTQKRGPKRIEPQKVEEPGRFARGSL